MTEQCQIDFLVRRFQEIQKDSIEIRDKLEKQKTNFNDLENNDKLNECRYGVLLERLEYLYDKHEKNLIHEGIKHESAQRQIDVIANNHKAQNGTLQALKLFIDELKDRSEKHIELLKTFVTNQAFAETKSGSDSTSILQRSSLMSASMTSWSILLPEPTPAQPPTRAQSDSFFSPLSFQIVISD